MGTHRLKYQLSGRHPRQLDRIGAAPAAQPLRKRLLVWREVPSWTPDNDEMGQLRQIARPVPRFNAMKGVHSYDETDRTLPEFSPKRFQRGHRVRWASTPQLPIIGPKTRKFGNSQVHHAQSLLGVRDRRAAVGRKCGGNKAHFLKNQRAHDFLRGAQMTEMNGVERTAKNSDGLHSPFLMFSVCARLRPSIIAWGRMLGKPPPLILVEYRLELRPAGHGRPTCECARLQER